VAGKKTDPAVLVVDECGNHVISLLSGHLGGANELTLRAAEILGAEPVITTATDLHSRFAVDVFAKKNGCGIFQMKAAKEVSAALLAGEPVGFYSEFPWEGRLPEGLVVCDENGMPLEEMPVGNPLEIAKSVPEAGAKKTAGLESTECETGRKKLPVGFVVTIYREVQPFAATTQVVPKVVSLGMGCRKNKERAVILEGAETALDRAGLFREAVETLASISLKKEEPGLLALSGEWNIPFVTFEEEELKQAAGDFTPSAFVKQITGVENVCERSAVLASGQGRIIQKKAGGNGVTTALALRDWRIQFE
jgi:cobalt-precorrin 5A hydrolase